MRRLITLIVLLAPLTSSAQFNFQSPVLLKNDPSAAFVRTGDFNGDDKADIAYWTQSNYVGNTAGKKLQLVLNHGNNNYERIVINSQTQNLMQDFRVGDFNGDGKDDLVGYNFGLDDQSSELVTFISSGDHFIESITQFPETFYGGGILVTDFDNDTDLDFVLSDPNGPLSFYANDGAGEFTLHVLEGLDGISIKFDYVDINDDGKKDFVTATYDKLKFYIRGDDGYTFSERPIAEGTSVMTVHDFDGDDLPDIVIANYVTSSVNVYYNTGNVTFAEPVALAVDKIPEMVVHADYDDDGREDMAVLTINYPGVIVFHNTVSGFEEAGPTSGRNGVATGALFVDVDGDGKEEVILMQAADVMVYKNTGGNFSLDFDLPVTFRSSSGQVVDLNNDGHADIVSSAGAEGAIAIHYGEGDLQFEQTLLKVPGHGVYRQPLIGDFNEDGFQDIIYSEDSENSKTSIFLSNNGELLPAQVIDNTGPWTFAPADYNNDGHLDFVRPYGLRLGDGTGHFTTTAFIMFPDYVVLTSQLKLNSDNLPDLMLWADGKFYSALNSGTSPYFTTFTQVIESSGVPFYYYPGYNPGMINDDEFSDFVSMENGYRNIFYYNINNGDGTFTTKSITRSSGVFVCIPYIADLDSDGRGEIIAPYTDQPNSVGFVIYTQNENGDFVVATEVHSDLSTPENVIASDVNGDQKPDVILFKQNDGLAIFPSLAEPKTAPSNLQADDITETSATLTLQKGTGSGRIIIARKKTTTPLVPSDETFYDKTDSYFVFTGDIDEAELADLTEGTTYIANAYEYSTTWDQSHIDYLIGASSQVEFTTATDGRKQQQITFTSPGNHLVGSAPLTLTASTTSELPLEFTAITTNISIVSGLLSFVAPGPATIKVSQAGNDEYLPADVEVTVCVNPVVPVITSTGSPTLTLTSSSESNNQWLLNNIDIPDATSKTYSPTLSGTYKVAVDYSGCVNTSEPKVVSLVTGLEDRNDGVSFYPNPATTVVNIESSQALSNNVSFLDILGRRHQLAGQGTNSMTIDISHLSKGQYVVEVQTASGPARRRMIIE